jgi:ribulose-5-phosphate 4-epimerase/fuculose-1-phosphate aldolase
MKKGTNMHEPEGVIKYQLKHTHQDLPQSINIKSIICWRSLLFDLNLIGQCKEKYDGLGYGNISFRLKPEANEFLISATQTGHLRHLNRNHFAIIEAASPQHNSIRSKGPSQPSSEALTHASVYLHNSNANAVIHVHSPILWQHTAELNLPYISPDIAYGSVEMAAAVSELFASGQLNQLPIFSMLGHEDGIVAFGESLASAAMTLMTQLAKALAIEQTEQDG